MRSGRLSSNHDFDRLDRQYGEGVTQDKAKAAEWWRKAAAQGDAIAQEKLDTLFTDGDGVTKD